MKARREQYAAEIEQLREQLSSTKTEIQELMQPNQSKESKALRESDNEKQEKTAARRIQEMTEALAVSDHKVARMEAIVEREQRKSSELQKENVLMQKLIEEEARKKSELESSISSSKVEIMELSRLYETEKATSHGHLTSLDDAQKRITNLNEIVATQAADIAEAQKAMAEMKDELNRLKRKIQSSDEVHHKMVVEIEELRSMEHLVTPTEFNRLKKIEIDEENSRTKIDNLSNSVNLHVTLLQKSEEDNQKKDEELGRLRTNLTNLKKEIDSHCKTISRGDLISNRLRADISDLKNENAALKREVQKLSSDHPVVTNEVGSAKSKTAQVGAQKNREEEKLKNSDYKLAKKSNIALRKRIHFLLGQLDNAAKLVTLCRDQKSVLKAELCALHKTNLHFRSLLNFTSMKGDDSFLCEGEKVEHKDDYIGIRGENATCLPTSTESFIERTLFDTTCGFNLGAQEKDSSFEVSKISKDDPGKFQVVHDDEGYLDIVFSDRSNNGTLDEKSVSFGVLNANEMLSTLQIPVFLRFVQNQQHQSKISELFCNKIVNLLNYFRKIIRDFSLLTSSSRLQQAMLISKICNNDSRMTNLMKKKIEERSSRQKMINRYVKEFLTTVDVLVRVKNVQKGQDDDTRTADIKNDPMTLSSRVEFTEGEVCNLEKYYSEARKSFSDCDHDAYNESGEMIHQKEGKKSMTYENLAEMQLSGVHVDDGILHSVYSLLQMYFTTEERPPEGLFDFHKSYLSLILIINLRDNMLTDFSCDLLSDTVEKSNQLRLLDLRENNITRNGVTVLQKALKRNGSILYVSQSQNDFVLEGHRSISSLGSNKDDSLCGNHESIGSIQHSMCIDIRHNSTQDNSIEDMIDTIEGFRSLTAMDLDNYIHKQNRIASNDMKQSSTLKSKSTQPGLFAGKDPASYPSPSATPKTSEKKQKKQKNSYIDATMNSADELPRSEEFCDITERTPLPSLSSQTNNRSRNRAGNNKLSVSSIKEFPSKEKGLFNHDGEVLTNEEKRMRTFNIYSSPYEKKKLNNKKSLAMETSDLNIAAGTTTRSLKSFPHTSEDELSQLLCAGDEKTEQMVESSIPRHRDLFKPQEIVSHKGSAVRRTGKLF